MSTPASAGRDRFSMFLRPGSQSRYRALRLFIELQPAAALEFPLCSSGIGGIRGRPRIRSYQAAAVSRSRTARRDGIDDRIRH